MLAFLYGILAYNYNVTFVLYMYYCVSAIIE